MNLGSAPSSNSRQATDSDKAPKRAPSENSRATPLSASFRDPSGFVFRRDGVVLRAIHREYLPHYRRLVDSGLAQRLMSEGLLVSHSEVETPEGLPSTIERVLAPEQIPYVSYAAEWCYSALQDAARATLAIQRIAVEHGMTLKDATSSNIQFLRGRPVWIDTLSFEIWEEGSPWIAYPQFCRNFLAPLALASRRDPRLQRLCELWQDGVPLDLAAALLPRRSWLSPGLALHLHGHARMERKAATGEATPSDTAPSKGRTFSRAAMTGLISSLEAAVKTGTVGAQETVWAGYYHDSVTAPTYLEAKRAVVKRFLERSAARRLWDVGGNDGEFSRLAAGLGIETVCFDFDHACVESNYRRCVASKESRILPLILDLSNPSPARGWDGTERPVWHERGRTDLVMALALIHHLTIGNNVPMHRVSEFFARFAPELIIEFVPKSDPKVQLLLQNRRDIFPEYGKALFESAFQGQFEILESEPVPHSERTLYRMRRKGASVHKD